MIDYPSSYLLSQVFMLDMGGSMLGYLNRYEKFAIWESLPNSIAAHPERPIHVGHPM